LTELEATAAEGRSESVTSSWFQRTFTGRRKRQLREYMTGYLMILPAIVLIFVFGIFPVGFALYVSMHKWLFVRGDFVGLANYVKAIDTLTYVLVFAIGIGALIGLWILLKRIRDQAREYGDRPWIFSLPAALYAATILSFLRWFLLLLPQVLDIADKVRRLPRSPGIFLQFLVDAFKSETVVPALQLTIVLLLGSILIAFLLFRFQRNTRQLFYQAIFTIGWLAAVVGPLLLWFTYSQVIDAYRAALDSGTEPVIWTQIITIGSGIILLILAWFVWRSAEKQDSNRSFLFRIFAALVLLVGGWLLIGELPMVISTGDKTMWSGLKVTIFYSLGTVPFQLSISMFLAILLFQKMAGSELFRMLFFLPYVTPFVASATVFRQMFSVRPSAPVNQAVKIFGIEPLQWLQEPKGIFQLIGNAIGIDIPTWAVGPSLALVVIMIYSIWVYVGYDTVIYLAGLGNISTELIEAAEIDGAGRWQTFRNIIFPLLSPTTYFLSLIAIIGTFKAFVQIYVMRHEFALGTTDTFSVTIFLEFFDKHRYGYASALAFVLFAIILALTLINNKIQGSRVFYG
jgi:multiple sugar transport system permease protein